MSTPAVKNRFQILDQLRGFFIVVIIIDHLSRWPSIFGVITGKAWLWVTAAEGFVIISGLLVGYVRGYKNRTQPMAEVSKKLVGRGLLLYMWSIIATIVYTAIVWYVPLQGGSPGLPIEKNDWFTVLTHAVTLQYTNVWVHFLGLYAVFLITSPIAIWLLRHKLAWLLGLISFGLLALGWILQSEYLQWQFLFFIPAIAGYYLDSIVARWKKLSARTRRALGSFTIGATLVTIIISAIATFYPDLAPTVANATREYFEKDSISLARSAMAFLWFTGLFFIFVRFQKGIKRWFAWLLEPIGTHSLTAYIVHGFVLCLISFLTISGSDIVINSLLDAAAILTVWAIVKIPGINRVIPR